MSKKLWNVFHGYDVDGGFGDPVYTKHLVGTVEATDEEMKAFLQKWDQPEVYEHPYGDLVCHSVRAVEVAVQALDGFEPYSTDPEDYWNVSIREMKERASK